MPSEFQCFRFQLLLCTDKRQALAAVCHEDATGRLHTVKQSQNALYHNLIAKFAERSGTHVVLNTSFNENEPVVDTLNRQSPASQELIWTY